MPNPVPTSRSTHATMNRDGVRAARLAFVLPAGVALLIGMAAGLARMGVWGVDAEALRAAHAPAMLFGFVGSLVALERAVAIRRVWAFAAPLLLSLGALALITPLPTAVGRTAIALGLALMLVIYRVIWKRQTALATSVQALAAASGLIAALLWATGVPFENVSIVAAVFLVLTIVGERIELGRVGGLTARGEAVGLGLSLVVAAASVATILWPGAAHSVLGAAILSLVAWLLIVDVARVTIASTGAARYMAVCLLLGYAWLAVAGGVLLAAGAPSAAAYDIVTHAVLLGFVMSMIMAHASVILPAVLRTPLPYRRWFYAPVALLQLSLVVRVIGDVRESNITIQAGGIANVAAILLFLVCAAASAAVSARVDRSKGVAHAQR
ncbi:hypothetical protein [Paramicrobacterium chengjingii]|uniref:NnrS family protein n=1 Tax=Paramicrobacterium chengjingii TaxID=2769067 RepID=A0ABX6YJT2_9MICO|nr:hypothetical protein [Microbacterium chengjingii]QPZ39033.1 hypothetical protein HCR76_02765 [Microbacterium chengjingii]